MVTAVKRTTLSSVHPVRWHAPSPLWDAALLDTTRNRFEQPALLRFAADTFMDDLNAVLAARPADLLDLVARPETWQTPAVGWQAQDEAQPGAGALKLYQPAHSRFYLVAAALVCRIPGLPDREIDPACQERASFVMRRWAAVDRTQPVDPADPGTFIEYGWEVRNRKGAWAPATATAVLPAEERLPLFALNFKEGARQRRLLAGFVPVSSRETYAAQNLSNPIAVPGTDDPPGAEDPRLALLKSRVTVQLQDLLGEPATPQTAERFTFILLDLAQFLNDYLPADWSAVVGGTHANAFLSRWDTQLVQVWNNQAAIYAGTADPIDYDPGDLLSWEITGLRTWAAGRLPSSTRQIGLESAPELPKLDPNAGDYYVLRMVYERPCCKDIHPPLVSRETQPFQLSPFFDPDAPTRPVRIAMPVDTTIAGLRRYKKDVSFIVSDDLRNKLERLRGKSMEDLKDGSINPPGEFSLGMICSLSIPIITICALVLLLIIVQLLNIVFFWQPFLKICFPLRLERR